MVFSSPNKQCQPPLAIQPLLQSSSNWHALTRRITPKIPFYYGVLTTNIFCRPTCTARLARRVNIRYFSTPSAAKAAGYKACLRCKPDDELFIGDAEEVVMKLLDALGKKIRGLDALGKEVGVTKSYLCRVFKSVMGMTIGEYVKEFETGGKGENLIALPSVYEAGMVYIPTPTEQSIVAGVAQDSSNANADSNMHTLISNEETSYDVDTDFDLNEWIYTEDFPKCMDLPTT
ncbi:hypothetical protein D6D01_08952 [Aureobasidium pullulans]|uniref:HTH araC/xylS-type domain-containing protein n=1 Tax=Aureobasidium pullulans TaxID=5580 RepID=A0A4S9K7D2_AURPU|nr:hypothetical protein D6D01_08952 [Aureobasidium pullulans]